MFPKTTESHVFIGLWQDMLQEHTRELKYMADMAGISFDQTRTLESLGFQLYCYNESYESFFANAFRDVKDFSPSQEFFETTRMHRLRGLRNHRLAEPSQLIGQYFTEAMFTDYPNLD